MSLDRTLQLFDRLDAASRQRALDEDESRTLQRAQKSLLERISQPGVKRELLRRGIIR